MTTTKKMSRIDYLAALTYDADQWVSDVSHHVRSCYDMCDVVGFSFRQFQDAYVGQCDPWGE
jgi:hypothetical protein